MTSTATDVATSTDRALITARHLINGERLGEADTERTNPARPGELAALSPSGTSADTDAAITAAATAQPGWAAMPAPARLSSRPLTQGPDLPELSAAVGAGQLV